MTDEEVRKWLRDDERAKMETAKPYRRWGAWRHRWDMWFLQLRLAAERKANAALREELDAERKAHEVTRAKLDAAVSALSLVDSVGGRARASTLSTSDIAEAIARLIVDYPKARAVIERRFGANPHDPPGEVEP